MKPQYFEVLSPSEVQQIDAASMNILESVGLRVDLKRARDAFREAGAHVDEEARSVRIPERLVRWAVDQAPSQFTLYGADPDFRLEIGTDQVNFAGLGTPMSMVDTETGELRPTTLEDLRNHLRLIDSLDHINNSQMDVWPTDIPMTTIHAEAILAWAQNCRKSFGMGAYGAMASEDMMRMMAIAVGGKEELKKRPRFFVICSVMSPLQMIKMQLEGMFFFAEYGQPMAMSPEAMAGATAPATLAGLLAQQNAEVLAHVTLAQIIAPGTPVLYGNRVHCHGHGDRQRRPWCGGDAGSSPLRRRNWPATTACPAGAWAAPQTPTRWTSSACWNEQARSCPPSSPACTSSPAAARWNRPPAGVILCWCWTTSCAGSP